MRSHFEPIKYINGQAKISLNLEDLTDEYVYDKMWLENDDKETDIIHLIKQHRIRTF